MTSILKMNFLLNIEIYTFPVMKYQEYFSGKLGPCHLSSFINPVSICSNSY